MKFTQVLSQYNSQLGPICRTNNVSQQFSCLTLDNGTERWRKQSWITSGGHTLIGINLRLWKQMTIAKITIGNLVIN
jgi:hypothetical protein